MTKGIEAAALAYEKAVKRLEASGSGIDVASQMARSDMYVAAEKVADLVLRHVKAQQKRQPRAKGKASPAILRDLTLLLGDAK